MSRSVRVYRGLLRAYPRRFRDEYGADMALLFSDQLRDEPATRVWARSFVDLAITVPTRHLEDHMKHPPSQTLPILYAATSVTGVLFAIMAGSSLWVAAIGLAVAVVTGVLAFTSWRHTRALSVARPASARWWQVLLFGIGVLASTIVVLNVVGEVSSGWWAPMMLILLGGILITVAGLILGIARLASNRPHAAPA